MKTELFYTSGRYYLAVKFSKDWNGKSLCLICLNIKLTHIICFLITSMHKVITRKNKTPA